MPIPFLSVFAAFQGIRASHSIAVPGINASKESCSEHDVLNLMQELPVSLYYVFSIRKFSGGCHRSGLHFAGEAYIYVRLASAKKFQYISSSFFHRLNRTSVPLSTWESTVISWPSFFRIFRLKYSPIPVARLSSRPLTPV